MRSNNINKHVATTGAKHPESVNFVCENILLVDDDRVPRYYARQALEAEGYQVVEARDGAEAIEILSQQEVNAVLLDINMPGTNGLEVCRQIRSDINDPYLPVVIVTGQYDFESIDYAFEVGATDFCVKPVNWSILKKRLRYLIDAHKLSQDLRVSESYRDEMLKAIPDIMMRIREDGSLLELKTGVEQAGPLTLMLDDSSIHNLLPKDILDSFTDRISEVLQDDSSCQFELKLWHGKQNYYYEVRMFTAGNTEVLAVLRDITEMRLDHENLRYIAYRDEVTGLHNLSYIRQQFDSIFTPSVDNHAMAAVLRIEIVDLEHIDSALGTESGDELLRVWASRLSNSVNSLCGHDTQLRVRLIGRVNGPGFIVILDGVSDQSELYEFAKQLERVMAETLLIDQYEMSVISIIAASLARPGEQSAGALINKAELALANARKSNEKGISFYNDESHARAQHQVSMTQDLRRAIENGELHLEYQPKISTDTGHMVGVEALVRWQDDARGLVLPDAFIPLAEESGLILGLGDFVLNEACRQSQDWSRVAGRVIPVAINFSGHQFNQRGLLESVQSAMSLFSIGSGQLEVELTESTAIRNSEKVRKILNQFNQRGIKTAIDDFGTGYSSLSSLRNFSFNTLKIDRSFVKSVGSDPHASAITEAIIQMSHILGLQVVAEGVEDAQQYGFLKDKGCDVIQGYFTGRPMSASDIQQQYLSS